jgi:hypothetical protein
MKTKMKQIIIFLLFSNLFSAQVLDAYPEGQDFYKGGEEQFFKELNKVLIDSKLNPCENKKEVFFMKILVYPDSHISFVQELDTKALENNKCANDLVKKALAKLDNFTPAIYENKPTPAIASFYFYPDDLFGNYKENYSPNEEEYHLAEFPGGMKSFRSLFISCFSDSNFSYNMDFKFVINFEVNTIGEIQNIMLDKNFENKKFADRIVKCVIPKNNILFTPGTFKGTPVITKFRMPINIKNSY